LKETKPKKSSTPSLNTNTFKNAETPEKNNFPDCRAIKIISRPGRSKNMMAGLPINQSQANLQPQAVQSEYYKSISDVFDFIQINGDSSQSQFS
jgi:hypothetical protein